MAEQRLETREIVIVPPEERTTSDFLTDYEAPRAISIRAQQIAQTASEFADNTGIDNAVERARRELLAGRSPLKIRRKVGEKVVNGKVVEYQEEWAVRELGIPAKIRAAGPE